MLEDFIVASRLKMAFEIHLGLIAAGLLIFQCDCRCSWHSGKNAPDRAKDSTGLPFILAESILRCWPSCAFYHPGDSVKDSFCWGMRVQK
jgi:hypothetical protein